MTPKRAPLFLKRRSYRRRRLHDAARLLPVFGAFLVFLPMLWAPAATETRDTAPDGLYLFAIWAAMIGAAALLAPGLSSDSPDEPEDGQEEG